MPKIYAPWTDEDWDIILLPEREQQDTASTEAILMIRDDRGDADIMANLYGQGFSHVFKAFIGVSEEEADDAFRGLDVHPHEVTHEDRQIRAVAYERDANAGRTGMAAQMIYFDVLEEVGESGLGGVNARCFDTRRCPMKSHHNYMATFGLDMDDAYEICSRKD